MMMNERASETEMRARIQTLQAQRNAALDEIFLMSGQIAVLQERVAQLGQELVKANQRQDLPT